MKTAQKTLKPGTIFCRDNLPVLRGINSESVDLVYLDPPFNKGRAFHAPIGTTAEGADFRDIWTPSDVKDEWHNEIADRHPGLYKYLEAVENLGSRSAKYYLIYMAVRLLEIHRILTPAGTVYLHCDPTASHYLKLLMDAVLGRDNFRNEIVWWYDTGGMARKDFSRKHDIILRYGKGPDCFFNPDAVKTMKNESQRRRFELAQKYEGENTYRLSSETKYPHDVFQIHAINPKGKERVGYPTQKPLTLLERIIRASSEEGDLVLDPFCGCATTCIAAARLGRKWVGVDVSRKAYDLVKLRLQKEVPPDLFTGKPIFREDRPTRTDTGYRRKFTAADVNRKYGEQDGRCVGCRVKFDKRHLTKDHIIPQRDGGGNDYDNLQLLCGNCNSIKGSRPMEYLRARLRAYSD